MGPVDVEGEGGDIDEEEEQQGQDDEGQDEGGQQPPGGHLLHTAKGVAHCTSCFTLNKLLHTAQAAAHYTDNCLT